MSESAESIEWFECDTCGSIALGEGEFICCDAPMSPIEDEERPISQPSPGKLMRTVFDMSETEMDICLCLMEAGEVTAEELADQTDYARSLIARHLNHLAELGVVEKHRQILKQGGHTYTYSHADPETVRHGFTRLFLWWVQHGYSIIETFQREKLEAIVESDVQEPQWRIYQDD